MVQQTLRPCFIEELNIGSISALLAIQFRERDGVVMEIVKYPLNIRSGKQDPILTFTTVLLTFSLRLDRLESRL